MPKVDPITMASTISKVFFGGDAAFGPKNIIWAVAHGHDAALSIHKFLSGENITERPLPDVQISSQKMGIHEWSYDNDISNDRRYRVPHRDKVIALKDIRAEVELGYDVKLALGEAQRCLNCDIQTVFTSQLCIECDACVDICPMDCITFTANGEEADLRTRLKAPSPHLEPSPLRRRRPEDRPGDGEGRRRLPALRAVRRTLPHRSVGHAKVSHRHDPRRNTMPVPSPISSVTTSSSGSPTSTAQAPRAPTNCSPDPSCGWACRYRRATSSRQHPGPADLVRGARHSGRSSRRPRRHRHDGGDEPADLGQRRRLDRAGGYLFYDSTKPMPSSKFRPDITVLGVPLTAITNSTYTDPRQRQLFKNSSISARCRRCSIWIPR